MAEFDPNILLQSLLARQQNQQNTAAMQQQAEQFRAQLAIRQQEADIQKRIADLQARQLEFDIGQAEQRASDIDAALMPETSPDAITARGRLLFEGGQQAALGLGLGTGAINMDDFAKILAGERLTANQAGNLALGLEQDTTTRRGQDITFRLGQGELFIKAAQHNAQVTQNDFARDQVLASALAGVFAEYPATLAGAAQGAFAGVTKPSEIIQRAAALPGMQGDSLNNFSKTIWDRTLATAELEAEQAKARAALVGASGTAASDLLDKMTKFYDAAAKAGTKEDMDPQQRAIALQGFWIAHQGMMNTLTAMDVFGERPLGTLPPGKTGRKLEDKVLGPTSIGALLRQDDITTEDLASITLADPASVGPNLDFFLGLGGGPATGGAPTGTADGAGNNTSTKADLPSGGLPGAAAGRGGRRAQKARATLPIISQQQLEQSGLFQPGQAPQTQQRVPTPDEARAEVETIIEQARFLSVQQKQETAAYIEQLHRGNLISGALLRQARAALFGG